MASEKKNKKTAKGGEIVRYEPEGMKFLESESTFVEVFKHTGCLMFCQKLQGHHTKVAY